MNATRAPNPAFPSPPLPRAQQADFQNSLPDTFFGSLRSQQRLDIRRGSISQHTIVCSVRIEEGRAVIRKGFESEDHACSTFYIFFLFALGKNW